ncbi:MAG: hypothetical protein IH827_09940, partial [Myxococcales bacterium]|nr:hypothetical protein [Myxococcales bacterium]
MNVIRYFASRYRAQSLLVLFCILIGTLLEGLGISVLLPVFALVFKETPDASDPTATSAPGETVDKA